MKKLNLEELSKVYGAGGGGGIIGSIVGNVVGGLLGGASQPEVKYIEPPPPPEVPDEASEKARLDEERTQKARDRAIRKQQGTKSNNLLFLEEETGDE